MKTRAFGEPEISISEIGLRIAPLAPDLPMAAFETDINYFEATDAAAEVLLRTALGELRHNLLIGTFAVPESLKEDCAASQARLELEQLGVLWVRAQSADEPALEQALAKVRKLQAAGQLRSFGFSVAQLPEEEQIAAGRWAIETASAPLLQISFSLHEPRVGRELFPLGQEAQTAFVVVLPKETTLLDQWLGNKLAEVVSTLTRKTQPLRFLTESGRTLAQAAIKFALAQPSVVCVLPTINSLSDLQSTLAAADAPDLTRGELDRLDELAAHGFHLTPTEPPSAYNG